MLAPPVPSLPPSLRPSLPLSYTLPQPSEQGLVGAPKGGKGRGTGAEEGNQDTFWRCDGLVWQIKD